MLNIMSRGFDRAHTDIWCNMLIKLRKQIENSFTKVINTKVISKTLTNS